MPDGPFVGPFETGMPSFCDVQTDSLKNWLFKQLSCLIYYELTSCIIYS